MKTCIVTLQAWLNWQYEKTSFWAIFHFDLDCPDHMTETFVKYFKFSLLGFKSSN